MFCKIYYTCNFRNGHTSSETINDFISCKITEDGRGIKFKFGNMDNPKCIEQSVSDIEDIKILNVNPMIF